LSLVIFQGGLDEVLVNSTDPTFLFVGLRILGQLLGKGFGINLNMKNILLSHFSKQTGFLVQIFEMFKYLSRKFFTS
jgi:hypothetical protein